MQFREPPDDSPIPEETQGAQTLEGTLLSIVYANAGGFTVGRFEVEGELFPIVATGEMFAPSAGDTYILSGEWVEHPKYGRQFKWSSYEVAYPSTREGIERYLSSGLIKGIGKTYARKIVDAFGTDAIAVLNDEPDRLAEIPGIGKKRLARIRESWEEQRGFQTIMLFLKEHDISTGYAVRIYRTYGPHAVNAIRSNPYRLIDDVDGIGFVLADRIARRMGIDAHAPARLTAGIVHVLREGARAAGHTYLPAERCLAAARDALDADAEEVMHALREAVAGALLVSVDDRVYLPELYAAETAVADSLARISAQEPRATDHRRIEEKIRGVEARLGIEFAPVQVEAMHKCADEPAVILTGGPGTGKTTTVAGLLALLRDLGQTVALCAPTGRAAKRLAEITGTPAQTIHRLLEFDPRDRFFARNGQAPLDADVVIVDETSMVDVQLMAALLGAVRDDARVVFVGDADQLPSVGPGNVLRDMLDARRIAAIALQRIFRQAEGSSIVTNAHRVKAGFMPVFGKGTHLDRYEHAETIALEVKNFVVHRIPSGTGLDPLRDIQVLSPMHNTPVGVRHLNQMLQKELNPHGRIVYHKGDRIRRLGDKVMQTRNNYEKDIYNGDIGFIRGMDEDEARIIIEFDGRHVPLSFEEMDDVTLAYAMTIHKSQGSEYEAVVVPLTLQHRIMLQRNLIYTAMTRARRYLVFVGQKEALAAAVANDRVALRYSGLRESLSERLR